MSPDRKVVDVSLRPELAAAVPTSKALKTALAQLSVGQEQHHDTIVFIFFCRPAGAGGAAAGPRPLLRGVAARPPTPGRLT